MSNYTNEEINKNWIKGNISINKYPVEYKMNPPNFCPFIINVSR